MPLADPKFNASTPEEQLVVLRNLTKRTGIMHEAQLLQLRLWPFAIDPSLEHAEAAVDMDASLVQYDWKDRDKGDGFAPDKNYVKRLERLSEGIKFLLGPSWRMQVEMNGHLIFPWKKSNVRKTKPDPKKRASRASRTARRKNRKR